MINSAHKDKEKDKLKFNFNQENFSGQSRPSNGSNRPNTAIHNSNMFRSNSKGRVVVNRKDINNFD